ncbi:hypothetical protein SAMN04487891_11819 [Flagellimonas taeanensis]|uniref:Uncharacterized protein n=1 Tax=Flagellimonas taeanensis TaxID=1005926 RepID=A0A1M7CU59_9FLAO|nr:hypothetical protein SAMN04487891_11819 [Allomuricauda taeanensis]SHL70623.1 hypothetical protein SAMN05216293_4111 [Allomuricauda taeanensis]
MQAQLNIKHILVESLDSKGLALTAILYLIGCLTKFDLYVSIQITSNLCNFVTEITLSLSILNTKAILKRIH